MGFFNIIGEKFSSTPMIFIGNQAYAAGGGDYHYCGTVSRLVREGSMLREFVLGAKKDMQGKGWEARLDRAEMMP